MKIEAYSFGRMQVDGEVYTSDLIIYPDRIDASWWRQQGHLLQMADLREILKTGPEVIVVGSGNMGVMKVSKDLRQEVAALGIEFHALKTGKAVELFNALPEGRKVVGAFHLTC